MSDSGNSGAGGRVPERTTVCKRCGHVPCRCLIYLTEAIGEWAGVDHDQAAKLADQVWEATKSTREATTAEVAPIMRPCVYCGDPVHKLTDGSVVANAVGPNLALVPDPTCGNSPTKRHAVP